jgi:very-short-patch-repair endonuclease
MLTEFIIMKDTMKAEKSNNYCYNKNLKQLANTLRMNLTKSEACLWKYALRARKMKGYQFRRQRPVLNYIADFMCKELKLIIELDGITHQNDDAVVKDNIRTLVLENVGFTVIRFTDEEVFTDLPGVICSVEKVIDYLELLHPRPSDTPASGG